MKGRILIIEDEQDLAELMQLYLEKDGFDCLICNTAEEALLELKSRTFDLLTLDINLPGMDGFEFLTEFRKNYSCPVLILSARESDEDVILGLGIGADEFVSKPVSPRVFVARLKALLRRNQEKEAGIKPIQWGNFSLDTENFVLKKDNEKINLSTKEFDLLCFLVQNPDTLFSSEDLYHQIWKNQYGDTSAVGVYIQRLRRKLEDSGEEMDFIETVRGRGYRFCFKTCEE